MLKGNSSNNVSVNCTKKWKLNAIDIKTAFLQSDKIDREIYVIPPKEANTTNVWQLKKCIYGLGDASCNTAVMAGNDTF